MTDIEAGKLRYPPSPFRRWDSPLRSPYQRRDKAQTHLDGTISGLACLTPSLDLGHPRGRHVGRAPDMTTGNGSSWAAEIAAATALRRPSAPLIAFAGLTKSDKL